MGELEDDITLPGRSAWRMSPTLPKRARIDGEDSGVEAEDPHAPDEMQEKLSTVMMSQLGRFEAQLSHRVVTMRERYFSPREQAWLITQQQTNQPEAVQVSQAQTLSMVAERMESGLTQLAVSLGESHSHVRR